jgi:hypothetical protein
MKANETRDRTSRVMLGFEWRADLGCYFSVPQHVFRPMGLMLWDLPDPKARIRQCLIGQNLQIVASWSPVPARFFTMGQSYEQISKLVDEGIEPPSWCSFDVVNLGLALKVEIIDSQDRACPTCQVAMWGLAER